MKTPPRPDVDRSGRRTLATLVVIMVTACALITAGAVITFHLPLDFALGAGIIAALGAGGGYVDVVNR